MIDQLLAESGGTQLTVSHGDFATATVAADGGFDLVYLLRNTITNLTSQDEQVACFINAAHHLRPGGTFLIENFVPELRRIPPGEHSHVFTATPTHVGARRVRLRVPDGPSRHWWILDGKLRTFSAPHRYVWPSELDLMARVARLATERTLERLGPVTVHRREPVPAHLRLGGKLRSRHGVRAAIRCWSTGCAWLELQLHADLVHLELLEWRPGAWASPCSSQ